MQKIGDVTNTADSNGEFTNGNVAAGVPPTLLEAQWFNSVQREIINALAAAGIQPNKNNDAQLSDAIRKLISSGALEKSLNGADIPDKQAFVKNLGLITTGHGSDMIFFGPNGMKMQIFQRRVVNSPSINGAENTPITYPRAFPGGVWGVFCTKMDYVQVSASCELVTPTGFQCVTFNASTTTVVSNIVFLAVGW
ncbi:hypothetical protein WDV76_02775 [Xenorhabdus griffiniae]